jgi:hypothetical protein
MSLDAQAQASLAEAWQNTPTPYSQIKTSLNPEKGQYDFTVGKLEPSLDKSGMYCIVGEFPITAPASAAAGPGATYKRTLYVGTKKDKLASQPETRLNSPGLRFLKQIAVAAQVPVIDQSDAALCTSITGKAFGCRIEETSYADPKGTIDSTTGAVRQVKGSDFGRNVTPAGIIPARLDREAAGVSAVAQPPVGNGATSDVPEGAFQS